MANDNTEENFTGLKYLVNTQNTKKQYAMEYKKGAGAGLHFFGSEPASGETVYALADDQEKYSSDGADFLAVDAYKIIKNPPGADSKYSLNVVTAVYEINREPNSGGGWDNVYTLTAKSKAELQNEGYDVSSFDVFEAPAATAGNYFVPPAAGGQAKIARNEAKNTGLAKKFAKAAGPRYVEPEKPKVQLKELQEMLGKYSTNLTELARKDLLDPVIGRDDETDQALKVLTRRKQGSLCFTGDAGVGKTAMFSAVAQRLLKDKSLPGSLQNAEVIQLDMKALTAGTQYRGEFEKRIKTILDGIAERGGGMNGRKVILTFDELHSEMNSGGSEGSSAAGQVIKPFMTTKGVSVMATTTDDEYRKYIEKDSALASRFEKMRLLPPDEESMVKILQELWPLTKEHNGLTEDISEDDLRYIITMTNRYAPQESQPRKGEKVLNMAAASAEFEGRTEVERKDIIAAVAQMSGLSKDFLSQNDKDRFLKMEKEIPNEVQGQPEILNMLDGLVGARGGLNDPKQPWASFLVQGPTGTGKTEFAKSLARYLFGNEDALIKLDMGEFSEKHSVSRLVGAPPGYIGYDDEPGLTEQVRQKPYCVILLDEIEKAHPDVFNVLLPVLNDGKMTDAQGRVAQFNNAIIIMTSNLGAKDAMALVEGKSGMNFGSNASKDPEKVREELKKVYKKAREDFFKPEILNRIRELGGPITFGPLSEEVIENLATREIEKITKRLNNTDGANVPKVKLEISEEVMAQLCKEGYVPSMGARPLRGVVREKISNPLGKWLMGNREEIDAFVEKNGSAKLVIESLDETEDGRPAINPKIVKADEKPAVSNDNAVAAQKATTAPAAKQAGGPSF
jgi:ATP-dependent Clp protease ATP-binding subunit ClpC